MTRYDDRRRRLCTATSKRSDQPWRAPAMTGSTVCWMHGGSAPQVREKSRQVVLADLIGPALVTLNELLTDRTTADPVRLRAAEAVLNRTGYTGASSEMPSLETLERWLVVAELEKEADNRR
jgi:hypothetical protein